MHRKGEKMETIPILMWQTVFITLQGFGFGSKNYLLILFCGGLIALPTINIIFKGVPDTSMFQTDIVLFAVGWYVGWFLLGYFIGDLTKKDAYKIFENSLDGDI